jgi:CheY-like chemotaxis protein
MDQQETLLITEDNPEDARLLLEMLRGQGAAEVDVVHMETMAAAEEYTANHTVSAIFLDLGLPDSFGIEAVRRAGLHRQGSARGRRAHANASICRRTQAHGRNGFS